MMKPGGIVFFFFVLTLCGTAIQFGSSLIDSLKEKSVGDYSLMGGLCLVVGISLPCFAAKFWKQRMESRKQPE